MKININSPLMDYLNTIAHFIALNFIFILCCLPIITIGPAVAAMYQVTLREIRGEHGYLIKKFFHHFKEMFLQSFLTSLFILVIVFLLLFNISFWNELDSILALIITVLLYLVLVVVTCTIIYIFPLMARFKNGYVQTIKNAFFISLTNLKSTITLLAIHAIAIFALYFFPPSKIFMLLIGFSFVTYCSSHLLNKVFHQYEPEEDEIHIN